MPYILNWYCLVAACAGLDWKRFNAEQDVARSNLIQLYGSQKLLFAKSQLYTTVAQHTLPTLFTIQASFALFLVHNTNMQGVHLIFVSVTHSCELQS